MNSKEIIITPPEGYEIDRVRSTYTKIMFKEIEKDEFAHLPKSVEDIDGRYWYIRNKGSISRSIVSSDPNQMSSESRAEAVLALIALVELRDAWNEGWVADWTKSSNKHVIEMFEYKIDSSYHAHHHTILNFKSAKLRDRFLEEFRPLIEKAKELL